MNKIFAVLCIIGCTLAEEKAISGASRKLKTRQVGPFFHELGSYVEPVHPIVDYVHEPQVLASPVSYIQPSVVGYGPRPLVHTADHFGVHTPDVHQIYNYVPTVGYGPFAYGLNPSGSSFQASSSVSSSSPSVNFASSSSQQAGGVQAALGQANGQSAFAQATQQAGGVQAAPGQANGQSAFAQATQQAGSSQGSSQQTSPQSGLQTENYAEQGAQQTPSRQTAGSQNEQGTENQQTGRFQFGILHSGFGNQQRFGLVQSAQPAQSQVSFGQRQGTESDQSGSQQSGSASQQFSGGFAPSAAVSTVATSRQDSQSSGSQASQQAGSQASQQAVGGTSPAGTFAFSSPVFGYSSGAPAVRLIQPYNLSPSYAIHGFRNFQPGSVQSVSSGAQVSEDSSSGSSQDQGSGSAQQFAPASGFQFDSTVGHSSGSSQTSFRSGSGNSGSSGVQYSYSSQQPAAQPAGSPSGGQASGSLSSYHSSLFRSGEASQGSSSGSVQPSSAAQAPPAILRMVNDFNNDGSFNYGFESENGITSSASGSVRSLDSDHSAQTISGAYSYTAPDGTPISTNYYADETGFHAQGAHLPTPPPLPGYIARALQVLPQQADQQPTVESN